MAGLKAAVARRPERWGRGATKLSEEDLEAARALLAAGTIPVATIAKRFGLSRAGFYNYFPQARARSQAVKE